jgi:hypothetical protein
MGKITFEYIRPLFHHVEFKENMEDYSISCKIFECKPTFFSPPIYVIDRKDIIHSRTRQVALKQISEKEVSDMFSGDERKYILQYISDPRIDSWTDFVKYVYETDYSFDVKSLGQYLDENLMPNQKWNELVSNLLSYNAKKDASLLKVFKATLPRGFIMRFMPHSLLITPPSCGKTEFYEKIGKRVDKLTRQTLLGSVRWVDEKSTGLFHEQYYPLIVEQVESQQVENLAGFLLSFLELGKSIVSGGGAEMEVKGACSFIITSNPTDLTSSRSSVLNTMITILSKNTLALGRRFGIIVFGNYQPVQASEYDDVAHASIVETYRNMEERTSMTLSQIWNDKKVMEYCFTSIGYDDKVVSLIDKCEIDTLKGFLKTFIRHGYPHTRGGSVNMATVDLLPRILSSELTGLPEKEKLVEEVIEKASSYVGELRKINEDSITYALQ